MQELADGEHLTGESLEFTGLRGLGRFCVHKGGMVSPKENDMEMEW